MMRLSPVVSLRRTTMRALAGTWRRLQDIAGTARSIPRALEGRFSSLSHADFRRLLLSMSVGSFCKYAGGFAETALVVKLTGNVTWVGVSGAIFAAPLVPLAPWAGRLADRVPGHRIMARTNGAWLAIEGPFWLLVTVGLGRWWMVLITSLLKGVITAFDRPAIDGVLYGLVNEGRVANASALRNVMNQGSRLMGVAAGGFLAARFGVAVCLGLSAMSCTVVPCALLLIKGDPLHDYVGERRERLGVRQVVAMIRVPSRFRRPFVGLAIAGVLSLNTTVIVGGLAIAAHARIPTLEALNDALAGGSLAGAVAAAFAKGIGRRWAAGSAGAIAAIEFLAARAASAPTQWAAIAVLGAAMAIFGVAMNVVMLGGDPDERGLATALYVAAQSGASTIGAPLDALIVDRSSVRVALLVGATGAAVTAAVIMSMAGGGGPLWRVATGPPGRVQAYRKLAASVAGMRGLVVIVGAVGGAVVLTVADQLTATTTRPGQSGVIAFLPPESLTRDLPPNEVPTSRAQLILARYRRRRERTCLSTAIRRLNRGTRAYDPLVQLVGGELDATVPSFLAHRQSDPGTTSIRLLILERIDLGEAAARAVARLLAMFEPGGILVVRDPTVTGASNELRLALSHGLGEPGGQQPWTPVVPGQSDGWIELTAARKALIRVRAWDEVVLAALCQIEQDQPRPEGLGPQDRVVPTPYSLLHVVARRATDLDPALHEDTKAALERLREQVFCREEDGRYGLTGTGRLFARDSLTRVLERIPSPATTRSEARRRIWTWRWFQNGVGGARLRPRRRG